MVDKWGLVLSLPPDLFVTFPKSSELPRSINRAQGQPATWGLEGVSSEGAFVLFVTDLSWHLLDSLACFTGIVTPAS